MSAGRESMRGMGAGFSFSGLPRRAMCFPPPKMHYFFCIFGKIVYVSPVKAEMVSGAGGYRGGGGAGVESN